MRDLASDTNLQRTDQREKNYDVESSHRDQGGCEAGDDLIHMNLL